MLHQFGDLEVDTDQMIVRRAGNVVPLTPRPYAILELLIANKDRVVSKDEMIDIVWQGKLVSDAALTSAVRELRKAIGDNAGKDGLIRTFYGRGVRFVPPNEAVPPSDPNVPANTNAEHQQCVLAILPLEVLSPDPDLLFTADGFVDEIIAKTSRFGLIGVVARNSAFSLRGQALSVREVGRRLSAAYVLEGSVRQIGNDLRFTVRLNDVESNTQIWTESFDLTVDTLHNDQEWAATVIATSSITVVYENESRRARARSGADLTAWEHYCLGYSAFCTLDPETQEEAKANLTRSIELHPDLVEAHATLAYSICVGAMTPDRSEGAEAMVRDACLGALEIARNGLSIDARVPFAWVALSRCHFGLAELPEAVLAARKALELNPYLGWAHYVLGVALLDAEEVDEAIAEFEATLATSPQDSLRVVATGGKSIALILKGDFEGAIHYSRQAQLLPDAGLTAHMGEVCALGHLGKTEEAADALLRAKAAYRHFGITAVRRQHAFSRKPVRDQLLTGLQKAGVTE